jgi:hypothetical protein
MSSSSLSPWVKQVPRIWFEHFASIVIVAVFLSNAHDPALFVHLSPHGRTLLLYVDDMTIIGDDFEYNAIVKERLCDQFLKSLLLFATLLGLRFLLP